MKTETTFLLCSFLLLPLFLSAQYDMDIGATTIEGSFSLEFRNAVNGQSLIPRKSNSYRSSIRTVLAQKKKPDLWYGIRLSASSSHSTFAGSTDDTNSSVSFNLGFLLRRFYPLTKSKRLLIFGQPSVGCSFGRGRGKSVSRFNFDTITTRSTNVNPYASLSAGIMFRITPRLALIKNLGNISYHFRYSNTDSSDDEDQRNTTHDLSASPTSTLWSIDLVYFLRNPQKK